MGRPASAAARGLGNHRDPRHPADPRYTGRQVWNRARTDEVLIDVDDVALGHENRHRWNDPSQWAWSRTESHTPLIGTDLYERAQQTIKTRGTNSDTGKAPRHTGRPYLFRGLITCGLCDRKMVGNPTTDASTTA